MWSSGKKSLIIYLERVQGRISTSNLDWSNKQLGEEIEKENMVK